MSELGPAHVFGAYTEDDWAITENDRCLRFHPQWQDNPTVTAEHIWREAWREVERLGGFDAVVEMLRKRRSEVRR